MHWWIAALTVRGFLRWCWHNDVLNNLATTSIDNPQDKKNKNILNSFQNVNACFFPSLSQISWPIVQQRSIRNLSLIWCQFKDQKTGWDSNRHRPTKDFLSWCWCKAQSFTVFATQWFQMSVQLCLSASQKVHLWTGELSIGVQLNWPCDCKMLHQVWQADRNIWRLT